MTGYRRRPVSEEKPEGDQVAAHAWPTLVRERRRDPPGLAACLVGASQYAGGKRWQAP